MMVNDGSSMVDTGSWSIYDKSMVYGGSMMVSGSCMVYTDYYDGLPTKLE